MVVSFPIMTNISRVLGRSGLNRETRPFMFISIWGMFLVELLFERNTIKDDGFALNDVESFSQILASKVYCITLSSYLLYYQQ